jgi:hypothetical protein
MNCLEFENNVDLLAREADAGAREEAAAHEASCAACAARLADERALTSALRALASSMKEAEAHARVETRLVAAFRANAARAAVVVEGEGEAVRASSVLSMPERANFKAWSWAKSVAVASLAAAAAVALFILASQFGSSKRTNQLAGTRLETGTQKTESPDNSTRTEDASVNAPSNPAPDDPKLAVSRDDEDSQQQPIQEQIPAPRLSPTLITPRRSTNPLRPSEVALGRNGASNAARPESEMVGDADAAEIMTDFIPLMQGGQFAQAEGGHLVRVELPRSALVSFGLPVNYERAGGRVKADVLLGDDGIARAIRFVR